MKDLEIGDYVLATKYSDGDPKDPWAVGFFTGMSHNRYMVSDANGDRLYNNGFSRAKKISPKRGEWLLKHGWDIEESGRSMWYWSKAKMTEAPVDATPRQEKEKNACQ